MMMLMNQCDSDCNINMVTMMIRVLKMMVIMMAEMLVVTKYDDDDDNFGDDDGNFNDGDNYESLIVRQLMCFS